MASPSAAHLQRVALALGASLILASLGCAGAAAAALPAWTTYHHDGTRNAIDPDSTSPLPPTRVWQTTPLDGSIYGEPLVYGPYVYVATQNDSVYALSAATGAIAWHTQVGTPVPSTQLPCGNISPVVGITSTPVIDPATNTIYAVADTWDGAHPESTRHRLVALDLDTGAMRPNFPREVDPPFPAGGSALQQLQRTGLALDGGEIVIGYGGNDGDCGTYWGWLVGALESGVGPLRSFQVDSGAGHHEGAIWGSGNAPAVDAAGDIYAATGNGSSGSEYDYGDSVLKLNPNLELLAHWAPENWQELDESDADLGSSDPVLLPGGFLFEIGKQGIGVLLAGSALGGTGAPPPAQLSLCASWGGAIYVPAAAYSGTLYVTCNSGLQAVTVTGLNTAKPQMSPASGWTVDGNAVGPPIFAGGLVWVASYTTGTLYGLDPTSGRVRFEEGLGTFMHFATPSAGGGLLFAANDTQITAFRVGTPSAVPPVVAPPPSGGALSLYGARESRTRWREGRALAYIRSAHTGKKAARAAQARRRRRAPVGTTFFFSVNEAAAVRFSFLQSTRGRRVGKRCLAPARQRRATSRFRSCTRTVTAAKLGFTAAPGANEVRFEGRISRARRLRPGRYALVITATNGSASASARALHFTIVKR
jgi:outer membrane protein assembly factor BamB